MRIVIDMQGAQTESRFRGIGRYTISFAQAVVRNRRGHEIILVLSGLFPETIGPICAAFEGLLPLENILVWHAPGPVSGQPCFRPFHEAAEYIREAFLASLQPDVIHLSGLFEGYRDDAVGSIGKLDLATPVSVILYDLIPLLNPDKYLKPNPDYEKFYMRKISFIKRATLYLAISKFSRQECIEALGVPDHRAVAILTGLDSHFQPSIYSSEMSAQLRGKYGIYRPFILYAGGADERKNLARLIKAYAALPSDLRQAHQLVFVGKWSEADNMLLRDAARSAGLRKDEFIFTGYVPDEELTHFYNLCQLYVFPSWHEGFGLPALEAMACGAPVIGANTSSLPEVIGFEEALFDPFDLDSITSKIVQVLEDEELREKLRSHGRHQSKNFSWDDTAKRAILAWESLPQPIGAEMSSWRQLKSKTTANYIRLINAILTNIDVHQGISDMLLRRFALCIAANEGEADCYLRPTRIPAQISFRVEGPFDSSYSLALVNREVARALQALGHRVSLHSTEGPGDFSPSETFLAENPDLAAMHCLSADVLPIDAEIVSRNLYPPRVEDMDARFNFMHAYGWEESGFPLGWAESFNSSLQGMTVVSRHVRKVMIDHGVNIPIFVSSLGVDHWTRVNPDFNYKLKAKSFRFLHVSSCFPRKGADVMLRAYGKAFRASDDVTLVIKTFKNPHNKIYKWLEEARESSADYPHVVVLESDLTDAELKSLYQQCQALVAPSRAEGFGLPMAEAILSGLAVITTGWSGQTDFCTPETAWLIDYSYARSNTHFDLSASIWAEPDEDHLAVLMEEVFRAPTSECNARIAAGQHLLNENFMWEHTAQRMLEAAHFSSRHCKPKAFRIGWITSWNERCGIATYSEHLVSNMQASVTILASYGEHRLSKDGSNVLRCWTAGDHDNLSGLANAIEDSRLDVLVIQFNYGFFNFDGFARLLNEQIASGRTIVIAMHSTIDPIHVMPHKKLSLLAPNLKRCHRLLVHSYNDMNRLKQLGIVGNVTLFPHGIIDYSPPLPLALDGRRPFLISSYGFFLPHKGLLELIDAMAIITSKGINIRLNMVNAAYPLIESASTIEQAKERIAAAGLQESISLFTSFMSDQESLDKLSQSDLVVFPYQDTGESASGAVRHGIASGRPVAVTPLPIFEDVEHAVNILPGKSPDLIAIGIIYLMGEILNNTQSFQDKQESAHHLRDECDYSRIARRFHGMLGALLREY